MPFLREFTGITLQWRRPHFFSTNYELSTGDQLLATVNRTGMLKQHAIAQAEGERWTFQREGLMGRRLVIYPAVSAAQLSNEPMQALASIQPGWSGTGTLDFRDGRVYTWTRTGNWRPVWSWVGPGNKTLLSIKTGFHSILNTFCATRMQQVNRVSHHYNARASRPRIRVNIPCV